MTFSSVPNIPVVPKSEFNGIYQPVVFWAPVTDFECPGVELDRYWISTTGALFDSKGKTFRDRLRLPYNKNAKYVKENDYVDRTLRMKDGTRKSIEAHVLVARAFCDYPDYLHNTPYRIQVNHLDGIKYHNDYYNLENCDQSRNMRHVYEYGLFNTVHLNSDEVNLICQMLQDNCSYDEIENELISRGCLVKQIRQAIYLIHSKQSWLGISSNYNFNEFKDSRVILNDEIVNKICYIASYEGIYNPRVILDRLLDVSLLNESEIGRYCANIRNVLNGTSYKYISKNYNLSGYDYYKNNLPEFKRTPKRRKFDESFIRSICQALQDTKFYKPSKIFYHLGLDKHSMTENEYASIIYLIGKIIKRETALEISKDYDF